MKQPSPLQALTLLQRQALQRQPLQNPVQGTDYGALNFSFPWGDYPPNHVPFSPGGSIYIPDVGAGPVVIPFDQPLITPDGYQGVITQYSLNFTGGSFDSGSGDIVWQLLRNGQPFRNFERITTECGSLASPITIHNLRIDSGDEVTATVNHVANGTLVGRTIIKLIGYFYPQAQ